MLRGRRGRVKDGTPRHSRGAKAGGAWLATPIRGGGMTPVLSGPEARHHHNGEHEQDGSDANSKCDGECHETLPGSLSRGQAR